MKASVLLSLIALIAAARPAEAAQPWSKLGPFTRLEADPDCMYPLSEDNGPWTIMATTFSGPDAETQARELVYELRKKYKLPAYTYQKKFDFTKGVEGKGIDKYGAPLAMRYQRKSELLETAVLVGNYSSVSDPEAQKVLKRIKVMEPEALKLKEGESTSQSLAGLRTVQNAILEHANRKKKRGPMSRAFVITNPLLPSEYFAPRGIDKITLEMNKGVKYSLLDCPEKYTVQVASFKGQRVLLDAKTTSGKSARSYLDRGAELNSKLAEAAEKAHKMTEFLRAKGYEAYEFHDRYTSIVTVGGFSSVGTPRPDGKIEINPQMHAIMKNFGAKPDPVTGKADKPQSIQKIPFDMQPTMVEIPRRSISADYTADSRR